MTGKATRPIEKVISEEVRKDQGLTPTFPIEENESVAEEDVEDRVMERKQASGQAKRPASKDRNRTGKVKAAINDALGLPPGDGTPHGKGRRETDPDAPRGTLTSADREPNRPAAKEHEQ